MFSLRIALYFVMMSLFNNVDFGGGDLGVGDTIAGLCTLGAVDFFVSWLLQVVFFVSIRSLHRSCNLRNIVTCCHR